jgi:TRAP-type C4-dicarboxylate transport system permease small subunit
MSFTRINALLAKYCMMIAVAGLYAIVAAVAFQVFGRYVLNDTPTWAESLTLVLVLYVSLFGAAVGVRDAGHIGMESLLVLVSERWRLRLELVIHVLVGIFGTLMVAGGWGLMSSVLSYKIPTLGISEGWHYAPLVLSGALIFLFSVEHIIANLQRKEVEPAWL